jgi:TM2 domain-containing membrane protein YozV
VRIYTIIKFLQTKRVGWAVILIFILIDPHYSVCYSQDLYNKEHSQKYAEYLSSSMQYVLAAEEYERLVYFDNNSVGYKYNLIKSYRLSGDLKSGIKSIYSFYGKSLDTMPQMMASEYVKLQLLTDSLPAARVFINKQSKLSSENRAVFQSYNLLLSGQYKEARLFAQESANRYPAYPSAILNLSQKAEKMKLKSPFIAAGFSAIIPGTGKIYTRNWSDGLFSMLFVAGNAWQAYRGFNEHGIKSGYGWAFAGLSASFYIGNIIGAVKAAKRYNKNKRNEVDNQVFEFVRTDSF